MDYIPLEKPIADLEVKINELRTLAITQSLNLDSEISELTERAKNLRDEMFANLTPYEITQLARHPKRPRTDDLIQHMCDSFTELHGDRNFLDDPSIIGGLAEIDGKGLVIIGHQKGRGTKDNIKRNFGMPKPEGYRKALRLMSLAERFRLPIVTLVDTPGAYPGIGAEERGQAEAIAKNILVMSRLKVPIITFVIGEGGSGGALALAVANKVHMLEYSVYSVISPEGCATILLKDASEAKAAADALKLHAENALALKVIDSIIREPKGGAHRNLPFIAERIKNTIKKDLAEYESFSGKELRNHRSERFLNIDSLAFQEN